MYQGYNLLWGFIVICKLGRTPHIAFGHLKMPFPSLTGGLIGFSTLKQANTPYLVYSPPAC